MSTAQVDIVERTIEKTNVWLGQVADELGTEDRRYAYRVLRAVLHTLRDRLTVDEAVELGAQLPDLIRGIYYEGWVPSRVPMKYRHAKEFLDRVAAESRLAGDTEASFATAAVMRVLEQHVSEGELSDVMSVMPPELRHVLQG
jgi:uncharacterized protein (DUF2267 family)